MRPYSRCQRNSIMGNRTYNYIQDSKKNITDLCPYLKVNDVGTKIRIIFNEYRGGNKSMNETKSTQVHYIYQKTDFQMKANCLIKSQSISKNGLRKRFMKKA